jgi:hypothetical protein
MTWVLAEGFARRPLVVVEDHLYHMSELLERLDEPLCGELTVVCLDRPGPDTSRTVHGWLAAHPHLQVVAAEEEPPGPPGPPGGSAPAGDRFRALPREAYRSAHRLCQTIAAALRPGGLLLQDIQLSTLEFIAADRWWESICLASTVRGMFADRPPSCRFFSNKRGYEATFGRDLLDAGFDPRDVIDKGEIERTLLPVLRRGLDRAFPLELRLAAPGRRPWTLRAASAEAERDELERQLDLLLWHGADGMPALGGRALPADPARRRLALKPGSQEALTWSALLEDRLTGGSGLPVVTVGQRLAPPGACRAEITNVAARHLHTLRGRLQDPAAILTGDHAYRLGEQLTLGIARPTGAAPAGAPDRRLPSAAT